MTESFAASRTLVVLLFVFTGFGILLLYWSPSNPGDSSGSDAMSTPQSSTTQLRQKMEKAPEPDLNRRSNSNSSKQKNRDQKNDADRRSGLSVIRTGRGSYQFVIDYQFDRKVDPFSTVEAQVFREHQKIDQPTWSSAINQRRRVRMKRTLGTSKRRLAPGFYRVVLNLKRPPVRMTAALRNALDYAEAADRPQPELLSANNWQYEFAVQLGSMDDIRSYRKNNLLELKKHGKQLLKAWDHWTELVRKGYQSESPVEPDVFRRKLLQRLKRVDRVSDRFVENVKKKEKFLVEPGTRARKKFLDFAFKVTRMVNAMSIAVARQVTGREPADWPEKYQVKGYQRGLDVKRYIIQYHKGDVKGLRVQLEQLNMAHSGYRSRSAFLENRVSRLRNMVRTFRYLLQEDDPRQSLIDGLPEERSDATFFLKHLHEYVRSMLDLHADSVGRLVKKWGSPSAERSFKTYVDLLRRRVRTDIHKFARTNEIPPINEAGPSSGEKRPEGGDLKRKIDHRMRELKRLLSSNH